jgi:energy-converting hydrogenase Eha subunit H
MKEQATAAGTGTIDRAGAAASWVCAAHCLGAPILVSAGIVAGTSMLAGELFEYFFVFVSVGIAAVSLLPSARRHRRLFPLAAFAAGIALILSADHFPAAAFAAKLAVVVAGAALISFAHLANRRLNLLRAA